MTVWPGVLTRSSTCFLFLHAFVFDPCVLFLYGRARSQACHSRTNGREVQEILGRREGVSVRTQWRQSTHQLAMIVCALKRTHALSVVSSR